MEQEGILNPKNSLKERSLFPPISLRSLNLYPDLLPPPRKPGDDALGEEKRKKEMYKNVGLFPKDPDYFKYFEKAPHPDRFSDRITALEELFRQKDLNGSPFQRSIEFARIRESLASKLSDMDRKILNFPLLMEEKLGTGKNKYFRIAYTHLRDSMYKYFTSPASIARCD